MKKITTVLILLFLLSCSSGRDRPKGLSGPTIWITGNVSIVFPHGVTSEKQELLIEAAKIHTKEFELDWGSPVKPLQVIILDESVEIFDCDGSPSIGCHWSPNGPVEMTMGSNFETPALYHEYVHQMIPGNDHGHTDPRWLFWEQRRALINFNIVQGRSK